jgi:tetratricopeptide (TPR) repeat protein
MKEELLEEALKQIEKKKFKEANTLLSKFLETNPDHAEAWCHYGHSLAELEEYDRACPCFEKAFDLGFVPTNKTIYELAFVANFVTKNYDNARKYITIVIDRTFFSPYAWYQKGIFEKNVRNYQQAVEDLQHSLDLYRSDTVFRCFYSDNVPEITNYHIGMCYMHLSEYKIALEYLKPLATSQLHATTIIEIKNVIAKIEYLTCLRDDKTTIIYDDLNNVIKDIYKEGDPMKTANDFYLEGITQREKGKYDQAIQCFSQASDVYNNKLPFHYEDDFLRAIQMNIGLCHLGLGNYKKVLEHLNPLMKNDEFKDNKEIKDAIKLAESKTAINIDEFEFVDNDNNTPSTKLRYFSATNDNIQKKGQE